MDVSTVERQAHALTLVCYMWEKAFMRIIRLPLPALAMCDGEKANFLGGMVGFCIFGNPIHHPVGPICNLESLHESW